ncbi:MAG TPA: phosphatidylglycerophosphatase A [Nitrospirota bacterium]
MNTVVNAVILFIAQGGYSGRFPVAPGTAGTVVAVLLYLAMARLSPAVYGVFCVLIFLVGIWAAGRAEVLLGKRDSPSIVVDEIAGYLVAMFLVPPAWGFVAAGFVLFRIFDILKPWPLGRLQDLHGGPGVMLDDIGAGVYTNLLLQIAAYVVH